MVSEKPELQLYLHRLEIRQYEQFENCPAIELSPGHNLLLGFNGAGKTSLSKLIHAVLSSDFSQINHRGFDVSFEIGAMGSGNQVALLSGQVQNRLSLPAGAADDGARAGSPDFLGGFFGELNGRYSLQLQVRGFRTQGEDPDEYSVSNGRAVLHKQNDTYDLGTVLPNRPLYSPLSQRPTSVEATLWPGTARLLQGTRFIHESDTDFAKLVNEFPYKRSEVRSGAFGIGFDGDAWVALLHILATCARDQGSDGRVDFNMPFVFERETPFAQPTSEQSMTFCPLLDALGADRISFRFKITKQDTRGPDHSVEMRGVEIRVRFCSGLEVVDSELTFGQRRLIVMGLAALTTYMAPIIIDEVDNGLHPGLVEEVMRLIEDRQSFIVSHNKLVVDLPSYDSVDDLRKKIHICRRRDDGTQTVEQLSEEQAHDVFEKIEVGIMHPSDVLLAEGLW